MITAPTVGFIAVTSLIGGIFCVMPFLPRRTLLFGFHVPAQWATSVEARRIVHAYQVQIAGWILLNILLGLFGYPQAGPFIIPFGATAAYLIARRATRPHAVEPAALRSASLTQDREGLPGGIAASLFPFAVLGAAALWMRLHWDRIPETIPAHFDLAGNPNGWAHRTTMGVYGLPLFGAFTVAFILLLAFAILRGSARGNEPESRFRRANLRALIGLTWSVGLLFACITVLPVLPVRAPRPTILIAFLCAVGALLSPVIRAAMQPGAATDNTPDSAWKWGMFYYNPADPALMVQRRFGIGYTMNFGNRLSWVLLGIVGCIPLLTLVMSKSM